MEKNWKVAVVKDTSVPMLGGHGLHTAFRGLPNVEVVAHVDSNTDGLPRKLAQTQATRHYATLPKMLASESPDVVVLCSRHPGDHLAQIRLAAENGCHIYCEKPLCVSPSEADEIARIVEHTGIRLAVAHPARHDLAFLTMKQMIEAGEIGTPLLATGRGKCDHRGGGEDLIVLGTHILDLQTFFFGAPESVVGEVFTQRRPAERCDLVKTVEPIGPVLGDAISASFLFAGGVHGSFESRRERVAGAGLPPCMGLSVAGTGGTLSLRFDDGARQPLLFSRQSGALEDITDFSEIALRETRVIPGAAPLDYTLCGQPDVPRAPWFLEANRFAAWDLLCAITEGREPVSNIQNARTVVEMICGVYASHFARGRVGLPLVERKHPLAVQV